MFENLFKRLFLAILLFSGISVYAEDKAIIVFDASGSMWAQLEGKTKIEIAKKTLSDLVTNWDESKQLGLLAYGHRKKGDCKDIETLVPVGKVNKAEMISIVNKINPKGKTPISASIRMAAEELKFTEDNATVILISDGKETCNADPCATATELEKMGVNFTAHVIGFGVDKQTSEQLKCIAANTGGKYFPADSAEQLNDALKKVVEQPKVLTIQAINEKDGSIFHKIIDWKLINKETEEVISLTASGSGENITIVSNKNSAENKSISTDTTEKQISAGSWLISGTSDSYGGEASVVITGKDNQLIKVNFARELPKVTINAADEAVVGTELEVSWEAPIEVEGLLNLQLADEKPKYHASPLLHTKDKKQATMRLPAVAGNYVLRFYDVHDRDIIFTERPITLKQADIVINAPDEAGTGTEIDLSWIAPNDAEAKINLEPVDEKPNFHANTHLYIKGKKEGSMRLPATTGDYILRWYNLSDRKIVVERPIKLVEAQVTITAPDEAGTATEIDLSWEAPKTAEAKINLEVVGEKPNFHANPHLYIKGKKEGGMRLPATPGDYVLRWYNLSDRKIVVERPIKLVETQVTITAPDEAVAGTEIDLSWEAPKTAEAKINLEVVGEKPNYHANPHVLTKGKTESTMMLPSTAGDYVLRWYNLSDRKKIIERPIKLITQEITINAPNEAGAGSDIDISWVAPKTTEAKINLQLADEKPEYHTTIYISTKKKQQDTMRLPSTAGDYVLRWYNLSDRKMIVEKPIRINPQNIAIHAPDEAIAGTEINLTWDAPKDLDSFINIQPSDDKPNYSAPNYIATKKKTSEDMRMPSIAGDYILRWYNRSDRNVVAERPIKLTSAEVSLAAKQQAIAGTELEISWEAPKSLDSFINIQPADEKPNYSAPYYIYTKKKNSDYLRLPSEPGDYILRWFNRNDRQVIAERPVKLIPAEITLDAPEKAKAGSEIEIFWKAPKGLDAFINIQPESEKPKTNAPIYFYTKDKSSYYMKIPKETGNYVLRWFNRLDRKVLAERPITIISAEE